MAVVETITIDDWTYLARLMAYRVGKMFEISDKDKAMMVGVFKKIEREKQDLTGESDHHLN